MRTTPLSHWHSIATSFDSSIRRVFESLVGFPLSNSAYTQACLTPKLGGFGIRRVAHHADFAFNASRFEVFSAWGVRLGWSSSPAPCPSQREASFTFDSNVLTQLVSLSTTPREKQRLSRVSQPHAGSWVTAVPSTIDGPDALIRPQAFRIACRLRLGVSVFDDGITCCSVCGKVRGKELFGYAGRGWAKVACTLQSAVAQAIINRSSRFWCAPCRGFSSCACFAC